MDIPAEQRATAAMLQHLAGGGAPIETHASLVFVGADTVWKLKKAVRLPFLDFTRAQDRRRFAERELTLNSIAAKGLYRDVAPVTRLADGALAIGGAAGTPIDWIVRMARVPEANFLDVMAGERRIGSAELDALADMVAGYHATLPPAEGVTPPMHDTVQGNHRAALEAGLGEAIANRWRSAAREALDRLLPWMAARAEGGFVRRGHGDLHLGNVCLWEGRPVPFDALEFDETMATVDLGYDLAFLLMDLERRMDRSAANRVLNRYLARSGDVGLLQGLPAFLSMRAMIRAHVEARIGRAEVAGAYLGLAMTCLAPVPPVVVAVGGLPGSGKSTLARAIAPALGVAPGAVILRSDEYRKRRFGVAPEQRLPPAAYEPEVTEMVLADLIRDAALATSAGHAVIADATFMDPAHRATLAAAVRSCGTSFHGFWLQAPLKLLEDRIAGRHGDASDATVDVLRRTAAHDPGPGLWNPVDATDLPGAVERLLAQFSSPAASAPAPIRGASGEGES